MHVFPWEAWTQLVTQATTNGDSSADGFTERKPKQGCMVCAGIKASFEFWMPDRGMKFYMLSSFREHEQKDEGSYAISHHCGLRNTTCFSLHTELTRRICVINVHDGGSLNLIAEERLVFQRDPICCACMYVCCVCVCVCVCVQHVSCVNTYTDTRARAHTRTRTHNHHLACTEHVCML
jgi:hypothetical protein